MQNKTLNIFTIDFPYGNGEPFLKNEIDILSGKFDKIIVYPMNFKETVVKYDLPENVVIKHQDIFCSYNRLSLLGKNLFFIVSVFFNEMIRSKYGKFYLYNFKQHLNVLLHRINAANALSQLFKKHTQPHLVYTYWFTQWTFILSIVNHKQKSINLFTRIHGMDVYEDQHTSKNFFFPFRVFQEKQIKNVVSISENGKQHLVKMSPQFKNKVVVNRLGVMDHNLNPNNTKDEFVLVSCSSFQKYKRVELIVEILKESKLKIKWIHFGDSEERSVVERSFKNIPDNVSIELKGFVSSNELMAFYKNHPVDLFINVSETEGIPVSIMEAISFGIPSVATNVGGVSEIVNDKTGFLIEKHFSAKNVVALIENYAIKDKKEIDKLRASTRLFWEENYSAKKNYQELFELLNSQD